jgi:hypothetical protein
MVDPTFITSRRDKFDPKRAAPKTAKADPKREKLLSDIVAPR